MHRSSKAWDDEDAPLCIFLEAIAPHALHKPTGTSPVLLPYGLSHADFNNHSAGRWYEVQIQRKGVYERRTNGFT